MTCNFNFNSHYCPSAAQQGPPVSTERGFCPFVRYPLHLEKNQKAWLTFKVHFTINPL